MSGGGGGSAVDLFGDLPEPTQPPGNDVEKAGPSLFDDLLDVGNPDVAPRSPNLSGEIPKLPNDLKGEKRKAWNQNGSEEHTKKLCKGLVTLKGYVAERKGEREEMQDAHVIINNFTEEFTQLPQEISRLSYFAVFDGHGGMRASKYAAQNLHLNLVKNFPKEVSNLEKTIKKCLLVTFKQTDEGFLKQASSQKPVWKDGSTATCVLLVDDVLYVANLGDSRAILCRYSEENKKLMSLPLGKEHNPTQYEERMRIQKAGGTVRDGRVLGVLEVSRSIGDGQYKHCGVISVPHVKRCQLTSNDRFVLLACDGLFKVFSPDEAALFVSAILEDETMMPRPGKTLQDVRFELACSKLASEAVRRGSADNVTIILVAILHLR
ncbi:integrin-linked kinase-associated serine/threonine phosphatase 2C [Callorhinchus milii]|uniref:integrin-linked kinase-associated serine/threonine phosphatase 2C n=1 Tax=Callorhinchus milii TaxID=7868 RepID=UPI000457632D|nr:integrin-linked kinase-associated serine/threonine phosphatase 2C [Callorhinchus milii]|eukprot:gi/632934263/ref/XP_007905342.1/ PREDICTED: integrin-linked kinase-associated serine/threonine phosphatase 2C [Callorhinchus milii]